MLITPRHIVKLSFWAVVLFAPFLAAAQEPAVPVSQEPHHHLIFENSYVRAYYVEVAPHDSTLQHRHDLPYFAVLLSGGSVPGVAPAEAAPQPGGAPRAIYSAGGISHKVPNPADTPFRNVTVELLHPQDQARNRCQEVLPNQPRQECALLASALPSPPYHYPVFETSEILVEYWEVPANFTSPPAFGPEDRFDRLLIALDGPTVSAAGSTAARVPAQGGVLWLSAGAKPFFRTPPERGGHFFSITFKDTGRSR